MRQQRIQPEQPPQPPAEQPRFALKELVGEEGFEQLWGAEINENPRRFILRNCAMQHLYEDICYVMNGGGRCARHGGHCAVPDGEVDIFVVQIFVVQVDHQGPRPRDLRLHAAGLDLRRHDPEGLGRVQGLGQGLLVLLRVLGRHLHLPQSVEPLVRLLQPGRHLLCLGQLELHLLLVRLGVLHELPEIGRASCRERV